jgi:hypothetical protein
MARNTARAEHFARRALYCDSAEPMAFAGHDHIVSYLSKDFELAFQNFAPAGILLHCRLGWNAVWRGA